MIERNVDKDADRYHCIHSCSSNAIDFYMTSVSKSGVLLGKGKCTKTGEYFMMTAQLPDDMWKPAAEMHPELFEPDSGVSSIRELRERMTNGISEIRQHTAQDSKNGQAKEFLSEQGYN
ncbi:hypothetical protein PENTCL1PPCAC_23777 [Pristionchus entomophagus]|uniref:Uncharacterized protein n=1 Tax=Pristionchus entomophagus TaxID=358040 RepID=A0AAV5U576_9BILA|nr:hypothetical protein PENTCL1PPCAC_23777 [Pristionchus entomophagus]